MAKTYEGKSLAVGGGGRFERQKDAIMRTPGMTENRAAAITAAAGRKKYGKAKFQKMAAAGRKRKSNMPQMSSLKKAAMMKKREEMMEGGIVDNEMNE